MSVPYNEVGPTNSDNFSIVNRPMWDTGFDVVDMGCDYSTTMSVENNFGGPNVSMTDGEPYGGKITTTEIY